MLVTLFMTHSCTATCHQLEPLAEEQLVNSFNSTRHQLASVLGSKRQREGDRRCCCTAASITDHRNSLRVGVQSQGVYVHCREAVNDPGVSG